MDRAAELPGRAETPEQLLLHQTLDADLQAAFDSLPGAFREAVWLRDVEEFSYAEIADMQQVPIGTVMSRIARGRRLLHDRLTARWQSADRPTLVNCRSQARAARQRSAEDFSYNWKTENWKLITDMSVCHGA